MAIPPGLFGVRLSGIGYELGEELISNENISVLVEKNVRGIFGERELSEKEKEEYFTNPEWILQRTGIKERYFAGSGVATSDLAVKAVRKAILESGYNVQDCEFIIVATVTPDYLYSPPTSTLIQNKIGRSVASELGLNECFTVDVSAACSSFGHALRLGYSLLASGQFRFGVVIGADKMSATVDFSDRAFCILLGDAAAAFALEAVPKDADIFFRGPNSFFSWSDGSKGENIIARMGGSAQPITPEILRSVSENYPSVSGFKLWQSGSQVFKDMSRLLFSKEFPNQSVIGCALKKAGLSLLEIDFVFFHQANLRIIEGAKKRMKETGFQGRVFNTIERFGNTTSASAPLGIAVAYEEGILKNGDVILICVFGGGYTASTAICRWSL